MRHPKGLASLLRALLLAALCLAAVAKPNGVTPISNKAPAAARVSSFAATTSTASKGPTGIAYHGGPIITAPMKVYIIWYGGGSSGFTQTQKDIVIGLTNSFSPGSSDPVNTVSAWWAINTMYYDSNNNYVTASVTLGGQYDDSAASQGTTLVVNESSNGIFAVVTHAISTGGLPNDPNGAYVVISHPSIQQKGYDGCTGTQCAAAYGTDYCAQHNFATYGGQPLQYVFVGVGAPACRPFNNNRDSSPNNDVAIDAALTLYAHELAEVATDPYFDAWYDDAVPGTASENADKCEFYFGTTFRSTTGGGNYNVVGLNGKQYLLQANWDFNAGRCVIGVAVTVNGSATGDPHFAASYVNKTEAGEHTEDLDFDFQGLPDHTFCITSDRHIAMNARFVGGEPDERGITGTWMDAISVIFPSNSGERRTLVIAINQAKDFKKEDCYEIEYDGERIELKPGSEDVRWTSPDGQLVLVRGPGHSGKATWGAMTVIVEGSLHLELSTEGEERIARAPLGKFLNMQVKELTITRQVHGVLGQMFAPGGVERRVNMVTADVNNCEYVDGIMEDYLTPSLTDPGCYYSEFPDEVSGELSNRKLMSAGNDGPLHTASLSCTTQPPANSRTLHLLWH